MKADTPLKTKLQSILNGNPFNVRPQLQSLMSEIEVFEEQENPKKPRTLTQNKAMWKQHQLVADELTKQGVSMRKIFEQTEDFDIPPTKDNVHDLWLYFQRIMYPQLQSTKNLPKLGDHYQKIHDVMMKNLGEKFHADYIDFPSTDKPSTLDNIQRAKDIPYDYSYKEPTI